MFVDRTQALVHLVCEVQLAVRGGGGGMRS